MRRILHIDMDAFFAAIEIRRRPELSGRAVVVGGRGDPEGRGVVAAASYEAREYGIHSAMPLRTAKKLCPHAVFLAADFEEYARVSRVVKKILREYTPLVEDVGIDEAYVDISRLPGSPEEIGRAIKGRLRDATGLTCSIGIGPNKLLAKTASDMEKPDGLTILSLRDVPRSFWPLPVRKLLGVGPKTEVRLKGLGVRTIGDLAAYPPGELLRHFGPSHGNYLHRASRGIDESEIVTFREPKTIGKETTFRADISREQVIQLTLAKLTREVVRRLTLRGLKARGVTVKVRFSDFETHTKAKTLTEATDSLDTIRRAALDCLRSFRFHRKVRLIGVRVSKLESPGGKRPGPGGGDTLL